MIPLSASLAAHQAGTARVPAIWIAASARRGGVDLLRWTRCYTGSEGEAPHAAVLTPSGTLLRVRNDAGAVRQSRVPNASPTSTFSTWTQITSLVVGGPLALAACPAELTLVTANGTYLDVRHSTDDGLTWGNATTRHTALAAITGCAVVYNGNGGDLCVFFTVAGSTNLYRLRRSAGAWGTAAAWSNSASVASLSGVAATHDGSDFQLLVTGTEVTTAHKRAWGVVMGDFGFTTDSWSALSNVAESDSGSTTTFDCPAIGMVSSLHGFYAHHETASPAYARAMYTHPGATASANDHWTEPTPHEAAGSYGVALVTAPATSADCWLTTPNGVWYATAAYSDVYSSRLVSLSYRVDGDGGKCRLELDHQDGAALDALVVGGQLIIWPGYASGAAGAAEYAAAAAFTVDEVRRRVKDGRATVEVAASTPWEQLAAWEPSQTWQTAAGTMTRNQIAMRIAGRAGFEFSSGSGAFRPSRQFTTEKPAFSITPSQHGNTALNRLLQVTPDYVRATAGTLEVVGLQRYRNAVMALMPRCYWRLGEVAGATAALDEAGTQDGVYNGSPVLGVDGFLADDVASAALFDGASQYVSVADVAGLHFGDTFSVVAWFKRTAVSLSGDRSLVYGGPNSFDVELATDNKIRVTKAGVSEIARSTVAVADTTSWHQVVVVKNAGTSFEIWLDGVDVTGTVTNATVADTSALRIGSANGGQYAPAFIADVALFASALSAANVAALWAARAASDYPYGGTGEHPISVAELKGELPRRNWVRVQGAGRYADAIAPAAAYAGGPQLQVVRNLDASTDAKVIASAANALRRELVQEVAGDLVVPFNAGQELFDLVTVTEPKVGLSGARYRVIGVGLEYRRGPKGARYDSVLTLGRL